MIPINFVRLEAYTASGYTVKAMEMKIANGVWMEGKQYKRAPDGHVFIDIKGVEKWISGG